MYTRSLKDSLAIKLMQEVSYRDPEAIISFGIKGDGRFKEMLECFRDCLSTGSSTTITIETGSGKTEFNFDGDGSDRILDIKVKKGQ